MDLLQLRYFCEIARDQNITKTAQRLLISQPALSKSLRNLEQELGVRLFTRQGRGIQLNSDGQYFYQTVERALLELDTAAAELKSRAAAERSTVHMANMIPIHYSWFLEDFLASSPGYAMQEVFLESTLEEALRSGSADLALTFQPMEGCGFQSEPLLTGELLLLVPPEHPRAGDGAALLGDFQAEPFISQNSGLGIDPGLLEQLSRPAYQVSDMMMVIRLVERGYGVSLLPSYLWLQLQPKVSFLKKTGRVPRALPLRDANSENHVYLVSSNLSSGLKTVRACREFCRSYFSREQARLDEFRANGYLSGGRGQGHVKAPMDP